MEWRTGLPNWHAEPTLPNDRVGYALAICNFWLGKISKTSQWRTRLFELFSEYPEIPLANMDYRMDGKSIHYLLRRKHETAF